MDLELDGKRALVTGGSRGIGRAVALQLALEGADVAIAARDRSRIDATAAEIKAESGRRVIGARVDTGDAGSIASMVRYVASELGGIDVLVNAAARPAGQVPAAAWDAVGEDDLYEEVQVKVLGYLRVAQAVAPFMIERGWGRIINVSGLAARQVVSVVGSVRNAAVVAMSKNLADALGPKGINVVTVHPGTTLTETTPTAVRKRPPGNLVGRLIEAREVAYLIAFLASPKSVAICGEVIATGGGVPGVIAY
jgi:NAD(P)-dependent dehydrogenase (short-subunit alcohol dehydrogenase family)